MMYNSLQPHEPQHARPPCASPTPGIHPNPYPLGLWCHSIISSFVVPFSSCPQSFPASGSFPISQLFASGGQSTGASASASVLPGLISFRIDWFDLLAVKGLSRVFSVLLESTWIIRTQRKINFQEYPVVFCWGESLQPMGDGQSIISPEFDF